MLTLLVASDICRVLLEGGALMVIHPVMASAHLCTAVFDGDLLLLKRLLLAGVDVDAADYDRRTALHIAAADGNLGAVRGF
jgi:ankyrin repeat protein